MKILIAAAFALVLVACGGGGSSESPTAAIPNAAPVANAGLAQNVVVGNLITLDGTASSDANSDPLTYAWTLTTKPAGSTATLSNSTSSKPTFTAEMVGAYVATVVVNDGKVNSSNVATVTITAAATNAAPVANAGVGQSVVAGALVTLDGAASSDANNDPLTYAWTLTTKPAGSNSSLSNASSSKPTFTADVAGTYVASVVVSDGKVNSSNVATVAIAVAAANAAPVGNAGAAQNVVTANVVTLDGSASSDANGDPLTYLWAMTSKPAGSSAGLIGATSSKATFTADVAGTYVISLIVNDGKVGSNTSTVAVTATTASLTLAGVSDGFFGNGAETVYSMPYATAATVSASVNCVGNGCSAFYDVGTFTLSAVGRNYTITGLQAVNLTTGSSVSPAFSGLTNGQIIAAGQKVTFKLQSPFTGGSTVNLRYLFTVQETGATFSYSVQLRTN